MYVCQYCHVPWPCTVRAHDSIWSNKIWMNDSAQSSIPCYVMDHEECTVPMFCKCLCHQKSILDEAPITAPPSNR